MSLSIARSINTDGWLRSLMLNILNTQARTDLPCASAAATFGHWSESYRSDGLYIGSKLWNTLEKPFIRVADAVKAIEAIISGDMHKLVTLKLADSVKVTATYLGRNTVGVEVTAVVSNNTHVLNLSGDLSAGTWVWQ